MVAIVGLLLLACSISTADCIFLLWRFGGSRVDVGRYL